MEMRQGVMDDQDVGLMERILVPLREISETLMSKKYDFRYLYTCLIGRCLADSCQYKL